MKVWNLRIQPGSSAETPLIRGRLIQLTVASNQPFKLRFKEGLGSVPSITELSAVNPSQYGPIRVLRATAGDYALELVPQEPLPRASFRVEVVNLGDDAADVKVMAAWLQ